jgi:hypothetical protein
MYIGKNYVLFKCKSKSKNPIKRVERIISGLVRVLLFLLLHPLQIPGYSILLS